MISDILEYLYADIDRLDQYTQQIDSRKTLSGITKFIFSIEAKIFKIALEHELTDPTTRNTVHSKSKKVLRWLQQENSLLFSRNNDLKSYHIDPPYVLETLKAVRAVLPIKRQFEQPMDRPMTIWICRSAKGEDDNILILLEDPRSSDKYLNNISSEFTSFHMFIDDIDSSRIELTGISDELRSQSFARSFANYPEKTLRDLGAIISPERTITSFYLVRHVAIEENVKEKHFVPVFGYPIVIVSGDKPIWDL